MSSDFAIHGVGHLDKWFSDRHGRTQRSDAITIAHRAAMRAFPVYWSEKVQLEGAEADDSLLRILRSAVVSGGLIGFLTDELFDTVAFIGLRGVKGDGHVETAFSRAVYAVHAQRRNCGADAGPGHYAWHACEHAMAALSGSPPFSNIMEFKLAHGRVYWDMLLADCMEIEAGRNPMENPLLQSPIPSELENAWVQIGQALAARKEFGFWKRWFDALLEGRPLVGDWDSHWALLHDIALIENAEWDLGADRVAELIELITQKHALLRDIKSIKQALENEIFNAQTLGRHRSNLPDDLPVPQVVQFRAALAETQEALRGVEAALAPVTLDTEQLEQCVSRLRNAWKKVVAAAKVLGVTALLGAAGQGGVRGMDWVIDEGVPSLIRTFREIQSGPNMRSPAGSKTWEQPPAGV